MHFQRLLDALGLDEGQRTALTIIYAYLAAVAVETARDFLEESDAVKTIQIEAKPRNEGTNAFSIYVGDLAIFKETMSDGYQRPDAMAKALLGEEQFGLYERFAQAHLYRQIIDNAQSTATRSQVPAFSQAQSDRFVEVMWSTSGAPSNIVNGFVEIPDVVIEQMAPISTKEQVEILRHIQIKNVDLNQAARQAIENWNAANQAQH